MSQKILIWGAGKIGRGLLGDLFCQAGYDIAFVDRNERVVEALNTRPEYTVYDLSESGSVSTVSGYKAIQIPQREEILKELDDCSLMAVAVLPDGLPAVLEMLHDAIRRRKTVGCENTLDIIVCANMFDPGEKLKEMLASRLDADEKAYCDKYFGFVSALTRRLAIYPDDVQRAQDPLTVMVSGYGKLPVKIDAFKGSLPKADRLEYVDNMLALEYRKYYTYNMLHATLAYMGRFRGHTYAYESIADPAVMQTARGALAEVGETLMNMYGFTQEETDEWNEAGIAMLNNPALKVTLDWLGADTLRKLAKEDRLTGAALLCRNNGVWPYYLTKAIAHALLFGPETDERSLMVCEYARVYGAKEAAKRFCGLEFEPELLELISFHYNRAVSGAEPEDDAKVALMKRAYHLGFTCEKTYKGCAQCTLDAMFRLTGKVDEVLFQSASGFSGGMATCGDGVCGGYSGGVMFMSSRVGRRYRQMMEDGDKIAQYASYDMAQRLHDRLVSTYGSVICRDIHKQIFGTDYCLRTKAVREDFEAAGAHTTKCTNVVGTACAYIAEILFDTGYINETALRKDLKYETSTGA